MATTKKSKKPTRKPKSASAKQRRMDETTTPEEMLSQFPAAKVEHAGEVKDLAHRIVDLIEETNYHPTVALDALQALLSAGIKHVLGDDRQRLWLGSVRRFHEECQLLDLLAMLESLPKTAPSEESTEQGEKQ